MNPDDLVAEAMPALRRLAHRYTTAREDPTPDDLVQDAALAGLESLSTYSPEHGTPPLAWFLTHARWGALMALRRYPWRRSHRRRAHQVAWDDTMTPRTSDDPTPEALLAWERADTVHRAVETLDPEQHDVLDAIVGQRLSHPAYAEQLGLSHKTISSRYYRAIGRLRALPAIQELRP